jgi:hypothetical protein
MKRIGHYKQVKMGIMLFMKPITFLSDHLLDLYQEETTMIAIKNLKIKKDYILYVQEFPTISSNLTCDKTDISMPLKDSLPSYLKGRILQITVPLLPTANSKTCRIHKYLQAGRNKLYDYTRPTDEKAAKRPLLLHRDFHEHRKAFKC